MEGYSITWKNESKLFSLHAYVVDRDLDKIEHDLAV
jgi:hypothetical protein